jgi:glycosyltransferase involved in cell wall biosynthesis
VIRLAIVVTDRKIWTGGYNYLLNLVEVSGEYLTSELCFVLFFGDDVDDVDVLPFAKVRGTEIVRSPAVSHSRRERVFANAVLLGVDPSIRDLFENNRIDVVIEAAQFFGWRIRQPVIAWMADFQHRLLKHLFSRRAYWRRELGFRVEIYSGRAIMLSSEDARSHCERYYPRSRGRTHVVKFAVKARPHLQSDEIRRVIESYGLPAHFFFLPNQFWRHKNHECVIRALGRLKKSGNDVVVAASGNPLDRGDPDHWNRLERLIVDLGVTQNFRLLGMIPNDHLYALLQGCSALINPSISEGWSTTVEEAKSIGTPMILSDLPVHREQATGMATFFDPARSDQLADILCIYVPLDAKRRMELATEARTLNRAAVERYAQEFLNAVKIVAHRGHGNR